MEWIAVVLVILIAALGIAALVRKTIQAVRGDPAFWEWEIRRYERMDRRQMPAPGAILFTGSSSIRYWHTLEEDMAPLRVVGRGFGGSQIYQVTHYAERIIFPYCPRAVVLYAGENDIAGMKFAKGKSPEEVCEDFKTFCATVRGEFPAILIYFILIKPPKLRAQLWPEMKEANRLIEEFVMTDGQMHTIDITGAMLGADGKVRGDLFKWDGIHLNAEGYRVWTEVVKPILLSHED
jgi:hypothetical protein